MVVTNHGGYLSYCFGERKKGQKIRLERLIVNPPVSFLVSKNPKLEPPGLILIQLGPELE